MSVIDKKVEELTAVIGTADLERGNYRLSDAIREGCKVTDKAEGFLGENDSMCAMSAAVVAAKARGYM